MGPAPHRLRLCGRANVCGGDPSVGERASVPTHVTATEYDGGLGGGLTLSDLSRYRCNCNN